MARKTVDETDIKILEKLDENVRSGSKEIGRGLKIQRQVVDYRIKKMESNGTILGYRMLANITKLGFQYRRIHVKLHSCSRKQKDGIFGYLVAHPKTVWVVESDGKYDLMSGFIARSPEEFQHSLSEFIGLFSEDIQYYDIAHPLEIIVPSRDFSGRRFARPIKGSIVGDFVPWKTSVLDKKIINELAKDGRQSSPQIAKSIGEAPEKVNYHIKQIMREKLVFSNIQFGYDVFGFELYKTLLYLKKPSQKRINDLKGFARSHTRIWDIIENLGGWQLELDIESKGHKDYYEIMDAVENNFSDILSNFETLYIRKEWKFLFNVFK
jgi:DNA-binding Lrp family transcriptional regulator